MNILANFAAATALLLSLTSLSLEAQPDHSELIFEDYTYVDYIKTVQFTQNGEAFGLPVVGPNERLVLTFDDMNADDYEYNYTVIHCDRNWVPSEIETIEYLSGFDYDDIDTRTESSYTTIPYTHHSLELPNRQFGWTISGNYLLVVFDEDHLPVITRRFIVHENQGQLEGSFLRSRLASETNTHHEVTFHYKKMPAEVTSPLVDLEAKVMQDLNWHTLSTGTKPSYENGNSLYFDQTKRLTFPSLIEARHFDARAVEFKLDNVIKIRQSLDSIILDLDTTRVRINGAFSSRDDKNGRFVIGRRERASLSESLYAFEGSWRSSANTFAEYVYANFVLYTQFKLPGKVFVTGKLSDYANYPEFELFYDPYTQCYSREILVKQGHYDYYYTVVSDDNTQTYVYTEQLEHQSSHDYLTILYYRPFGQDFDRVLQVYYFE